jgi:hypothetical protein
MRNEQRVVEILQISCSIAASRQPGIYRGFTYIRNSAEIIKINIWLWKKSMAYIQKRLWSLAKNWMMHSKNTVGKLSMKIIKANISMRSLYMIKVKLL